MDKTERWLSVEEIASHLGVSKETIYRWLDRDKIPAHRLGKLWKFRTSEVDGWVVRGGGADDATQNVKTSTTIKSTETEASS